MAVTNLTTSYAALSLSLTGAEGREVVVEKELHIALVEYVVDKFLVEFRSEGASRKALRLATGEDGTSVRHGQR